MQRILPLIFSLFFCLLVAVVEGTALAGALLPAWGSLVFLVLVLVSVVGGLFFALRGPGRTAVAVVYSLFLLVGGLGVLSFYVFNQPTTINIGGFLAVVIGGIGAVICSTFLIAGGRKA